MIRNKNHALLLAAAFMLSCAGMLSSAPPAGAQTAAPPAAAPAQKIIKTHFVVVRMLQQSLQVRSVADTREIHTFTYSPELGDKMQKVLKTGGYQYGDNVVVWHKRGEDIAFKIKGKPSKPN